MRAHGKELHIKEDTHEGDIETKEDVIDLSRGHSWGDRTEYTTYISTKGTSHEGDLHTL